MDKNLRLQRIFAVGGTTLVVIFVAKLLMYLYLEWDDPYSNLIWLFDLIFFIMNMVFLMISQSDFLFKGGDNDDETIRSSMNNVALLTLYVGAMYLFGNLIAAFDYIVITIATILADVAVTKRFKENENWFIKSICFTLVFTFVGVVYAVAKLLEDFFKKE